MNQDEGFVLFYLFATWILSKIETLNLEIPICSCSTFVCLVTSFALSRYIYRELHSNRSAPTA